LRGLGRDHTQAIIQQAELELKTLTAQPGYCITLLQVGLHGLQEDVLQFLQ